MTNENSTVIAKIYIGREPIDKDSKDGRKTSVFCIALPYDARHSSFKPDDNYLKHCQKEGSHFGDLMRKNNTRLYELKNGEYFSSRNSKNIICEEMPFDGVEIFINALERQLNKI